ncbi:MAG: DUF2330 domain-containing protein [Acidimicrobiales bacterium]
MRTARWLGAGLVTVSATWIGAVPVLACGGLVAPNGAVRLANTTTLAAWHAGLERYVTAFDFQGGGSGFGDIIPLPAVPTKIEKAGAWTLQRLEREKPPVIEAGAAGAASGAGPATVVQQVHVDALELTVLKGGGQAVTDWVRQHGFAVSTDLPAVLDWYARTSPVFLAVRFDPAQAKSLGQVAGDGTPIQITMAVPQPWVPLRILTLAKSGDEFVTADVFLLTDSEPLVYGPAQGAEVKLSQPASPQLLTDLRSDRASMKWIPDHMWLTYVSIAGDAQVLDNDLVVQGAGGTAAPSVLRPPPTTAPPTTTSTTVVPLPSAPVRLLSGPRPSAAHRYSRGLAVAAAIGGVGVGLALAALRRRTRATP